NYDPTTKASVIDDVIYRFQTRDRQDGVAPSVGKAHQVIKTTDANYILTHATYSTCVPTDNTWKIEAKKIEIYPKDGKGIARDAKFKIGNVPVLYTPYLSFPTNRDRKSGFLMPIKGYSNVGGWNLAFPYYLNLAPNYDATFTPHWFSLR